MEHFSINLMSCPKGTNLIISDDKEYFIVRIKPSEESALIRLKQIFKDTKISDIEIEVREKK